MERNERKAECKKKKLCCKFEGLMLRTRPQNGITLIALIITVIVMLILVGVTINVALNGGLFTQAQTAANDTQIQADKEQLLSAIVASYDIETGTIKSKNELEKNLGDGWTVEEEGSVYKVTSPNGNTFTVDEKGNITSGSGNGGTSEEDSQVPDELAKYILGQDLQGRTLCELNEEEGEEVIDGIMHILEGTFLDDPLTEGVDETQTLKLQGLTSGYNEDNTKTFFYIKYDNKAYRITVNETIEETKWETEKLDLIYEPKGTEGQKTADGWTILYDNGETAEAVSPTAMGELRLGYSEEASTDEEKLTQAITSYNNAITLINEYCETLEGLPTNSGVRSVGASTETSEDPSNYYYSTNLETWNSKYNGKGKKGDIYYEQDLVRMAYWDVTNTSGEEFWVASRVAESNHYDYLNTFSVNFTETFHVDHTGGFGSSLFVIGTQSDTNEKRGCTHSLSVRPIITIDNL